MSNNSDLFPYIVLEEDLPDPDGVIVDPDGLIEDPCRTIISDYRTITDEDDDIVEHPFFVDAFIDDYEQTSDD
jgi:hypothetical protein